MGASIKYNFILNLINTVVGILFPIVTFPYISRVIGPNGIGIINFNYSIVQYITLFTSLGIAAYAVREISRLRSDQQKWRHTTVEILSLHLSLTALGYVAVAVLYLFIPQINEHGLIFLILSMSIFFNAIGAVWFFQAHEDFKFILVRSLVVKLLSAVMLFTMVRTQSDLVMYAVILVFADAGNNLLNFIRLKKYIGRHDVQWREVRLFRHLKPSVIIFALSLVTSLYIDMPTLYLGFMCEEANVGYYTTVTKLLKVIVSIVAALGTTLLPRMSQYFATGEIKRFKELERSGLTFVIGLALPISSALLIIAPEVIMSFAGGEFIPSIEVLRITAPTILFIGIAAIAGYQSLYPQGHERIIIKAALIAVIMSASLNYFLIPVLGQDGAAIAYLVAEISVTIGILILGRKFLSYNFANNSVFKFIISTAVMLAVIYPIHCCEEMRALLKLVLESFTGVTVYVVALLAMHEELSCRLYRQVIDNLKKYRFN